MIRPTTVELPLKTGRGQNDREHFGVRARRVKNERSVAWMFVKSKLEDWGTACTITLTRVSAGRLDGDNLQGSLKAVRDGVADAMRIKDNDPRVLWLYAQQRCKRGDFAVRIHIEPT